MCDMPADASKVFGVFEGLVRRPRDTCHLIPQFCVSLWICNPTVSGLTGKIEGSSELVQVVPAPQFHAFSPGSPFFIQLPKGAPTSGDGGQPFIRQSLLLQHDVVF